MPSLSGLCYNLFMAKLALISDFHMDGNHFSEEDLAIFSELLREEKISHLHFAGDISNDLHHISLPFLESLGDFEVSYNLGNHDMVGLYEEEISESDFKIHCFGKTALLSFHGWYDYGFMENPQLSKIIAFKNSFYFDRKVHRENDDIKTTDIIIEKLEQILTELSAQNPEEIIIATHFVPEQSFIINTRYEKFARFNAYLGSPRFHETFKKFPLVKDVVFGHIHHRSDPRKIDGIRYHARPLGYRYEWQMMQDFLRERPEHRIAQGYRLRRQYRAIEELGDWQEFRQKNLKREFLSALTIFDL